MATLKDIAEMAGVKPSTVSVVLNGKTTKIRVSEKTQRQIREAAKILRYEPNSSARALVTGRSGYIGFILSDRVTGGWGNAYYAAQLSGVEQRCRDLGYGLSVSRYNISNIDTFAFPTKVRGRSVDGLILVGYAEAAIVDRFRQFGIPCVVIGDDTEIANLVPTVSVDFAAAILEVFKYAASLGHKRLGHCYLPTRHSEEIAEDVRRRMTEMPELASCTFQPFKLPRQADFAGGEEAFATWRAMPESTRPTMLLGSDQLALGFIRAMHVNGFECPRDVSIISDSDTELCAYFQPAITALSRNLSGLGMQAMDLIVNHLERRAPLTPDQSIVDRQFKLTLRESCRKQS